MTDTKRSVEFCLVDPAPRFVGAEVRGKNPFTGQEMTIRGQRNQNLDQHRVTLDAILDRQGPRVAEDGVDIVTFPGGPEVQITLGHDLFDVGITPAKVDGEVARFVLDLALATNSILDHYGGGDPPAAWVGPGPSPKRKKGIPDMIQITTPEDLISWLDQVDREAD